MFTKVSKMFTKVSKMFTKVRKMFTNVYKDEQKFSKVYKRSIKKVLKVSGNIHKSP